MTPALVLGFLVFCVGSLCSYSGLRHHPHAPALFAMLGASAAVCWHRAIREAGDADVYRLGLLWDGLAMVAYYLAPVLVLRLGLTPGQWIGVAMVGVGLALVKVCEK